MTLIETAIASYGWKRYVPSDDWSRDLTTRSGFAFHVRPADAGDEASLTEFFTHVTSDDLRFRFLSSIRRVGRDQIERMTRVDHHSTENFLAFDLQHGTMIATAMLAADPRFEHAEVAIAIHRDYKKRGMGWTLLHHMTQFAKARGISAIESIESRDNHQAIDLEREMGFQVRPYDDDPALVIVRRDLEKPM